MWRGHLAGIQAESQVTDLCDPLAGFCQHAHAGAYVRHLAVDGHTEAQLAHVQETVAAYPDGAWAVHVVVLGLKIAPAVEHLYPVVLAVGYVDESVGVHGDVVRDRELARVHARAAPAHDVLSIGRKTMDGRVLISIAYQQVPRARVDGDIGRHVKRAPGVRGGRDPGLAYGHEHLSVRGHLSDCVPEVVGRVEGIFGTQGDRMGIGEQPLAPARDECAVALEDDHRVIAPGEDVDAVVGADRNARDLVPPDAGRGLCPLGVVEVRMCSLSKLYRGSHSTPPARIGLIISGAGPLWECRRLWPRRRCRNLAAQPSLAGPRRC